MNLVRILGIYLVIISTLQMGFYAYLSFANLSDDERWNFVLLDPRSEWNMLENRIKNPAVENPPVTDPNVLDYSPAVAHPTIVSWLTAIWTLAIGLSFVFGRAPLKTYITFEFILFLPSVLFWLLVALLKFSEADGFSREEIYYTIVPIVFSLIPMCWAGYLVKIRPQLEKKVEE